MISARHLPALAALLALACIPTVLHSYMGPRLADGHNVTALPLRLNGLQGSESERSPVWVRELYGTSDFIERKYGRQLTLFVARSADPKGLYHHPENGVAHGDGYDRAVVIRLSVRPEIPVFVLNSARGNHSVYALLYDGKFIEHPIRFQLQNAFALLARPRSLMTLFFVRGGPTGESPAEVAKASEAVLLAAIDSFLAQPGTVRP